MKNNTSNDYPAMLLGKPHNPSKEKLELLLRTEASIMNAITHREGTEDETSQARYLFWQAANDRASALMPHLREGARVNLTLTLHLAKEMVELATNPYAIDRLLDELDDVEYSGIDTASDIEEEIVCFCNECKKVVRAIAPLPGM